MQYLLSTSALYTFLPLVVTVTINSLISVSLVTRDTQQDRAGCAGCRLQGGACEEHQQWLLLSREKDRLDKLLKSRMAKLEESEDSEARKFQEDEDS